MKPDDILYLMHNGALAPEDALKALQDIVYGSTKTMPPHAKAFASAPPKQSPEGEAVQKMKMLAALIKKQKPPHKDPKMEFWEPPSFSQPKGTGLKGHAPQFITFDEYEKSLGQHVIQGDASLNTEPQQQQPQPALLRRCEWRAKSLKGDWRPFHATGFEEVRSVEELMEVYAGPWVRKLMVGFTIYEHTNLDMLFRFVPDEDAPAPVPTHKPTTQAPPSAAPEEREFS